jgi:hypothetical protein
LKEWGKEEGLRSEDAANTAIPPQLSSTNFLPFQLHQLVQHAERLSSHVAPFQGIPFAEELHFFVLAKDSLFVLCVSYECEERERKGETDIQRQTTKILSLGERYMYILHVVLSSTRENEAKGSKFQLKLRAVGFN